MRFFFFKIEYRFYDRLIPDKSHRPLVIDLLSIKVLFEIRVKKLSKIYVKPIWKIVLFIVVDLYNIQEIYMPL